MGREETESEAQRARRLYYRERIREWQSFLDTAGRRGAYIPADYPDLPPPPAEPSLFPPQRVETAQERAEAEARALADLERQQDWARFFAEDIAPTGPAGESRRAAMLDALDAQRPSAKARIIRQSHPGIEPYDVYHEMLADYQEYFGFVPYPDETIRAAAGFTGAASGTRSQWKYWDVYTFATLEEALGFLRPQAEGLRRARRPVLLNAGGVLRAWEGTRYVTHVDAEGYHGWVNVEPSQMATRLLARAALINFEMNAKFSRVEAVALYVHK